MRSLMLVGLAACVAEPEVAVETLDVDLVLPVSGEEYDVVIPFEVRPLDGARRYQLRVFPYGLPGWVAWLDEPYAEWEPSFDERALELRVEVVDLTTGEQGLSAEFDVEVGWGVGVLAP